MTHTARRTVAAAAIALVLAIAGSARAQVFYSYPGAQPVVDTSVSLGLVAGFGDNLVRLGGFGRFNLTSSADLGLEAVWDNIDPEGASDDTNLLGAGADGKVVLLSADGSTPLDVAVQAGAGFLTDDGYFLLHVPFGAIASRDFLTNDGRRITPYGGVYFVFDYASFDVPAGVDDDSDTDFDVELRVGASAEIVRNGSLFAALHAGLDTMFFLGFNAGL
jgi:hypothetical protein